MSDLEPNADADARPGLAFAVRRTQASVGQIVDAIAKEITVLAVTAATVAHTLGTEPHRTNAREAFCVCRAHAIVAEIGDTLAEQIAVFLGAASRFVGTLEAHANRAGVACTRSAGGAVAPDAEASGETDAPVADVRRAIVIRQAERRRAFPMNAAMPRRTVVARDAIGTIREVTLAVPAIVDRFTDAHGTSAVPTGVPHRAAIAVEPLVVQVWCVRVGRRRTRPGRYGCSGLFPFGVE